MKVLILLIVPLFLVADSLLGNIQDTFLWSLYYRAAVYILAILGVGLIFAKKHWKGHRELVKYAYFVAFIPVALLPVLRCYFRIPYVFCRICPKQCPWGHTARIAVPAFLAMNLDKRFWCYSLCPFGTIQDRQANSCRKRISLPKWSMYSRYIVLLLAIAALLLPFFYSVKISWLYKVDYLVSIGVLVAAALIFIMSFFVPRFWCSHFCPIGTVGDMTNQLSVKRKL